MPTPVRDDIEGLEKKVEVLQDENTKLKAIIASLEKQNRQLLNALGLKESEEDEEEEQEQEQEQSNEELLVAWDDPWLYNEILAKRVNEFDELFDQICLPEKLEEEGGTSEKVKEEPSDKVKATQFLTLMAEKVLTDYHLIKVEREKENLEAVKSRLEHA